MRENELINAFDNIKCNENKQMLFDSISAKPAKKTNVRKPLVATALCCLCLAAFSQTAFAQNIVSEIKQAILSVRNVAVENGEEMILPQEIQNAIYSYEDENIRFEIAELLSDGQSITATAVYTAFNDDAREWLENQNMRIGTSNNWCVTIEPYIQLTDDADYRVNYGISTEDILENNTDNQRWFLVRTSISSVDYMDFKANLTFNTPSGKVNEIIDVEGNIEAKTYKLVSDEKVSEYFEPVCIRLSKLSFTVYGMQNGVYRQVRGEGGVRGTWLYKEPMPTVELVMTDGSIVPVQNGSMCPAYPFESNMYSDLVIASNEYNNEELGSFVMDIESVVAVKINGVEFDFE